MTGVNVGGLAIPAPIEVDVVPVREAVDLLSDTPEVLDRYFQWVDAATYFNGVAAVVRSLVLRTGGITDEAKQRNAEVLRVAGAAVRTAGERLGEAIKGYTASRP